MNDLSELLCPLVILTPIALLAWAAKWKNKRARIAGILTVISGTIGMLIYGLHVAEELHERIHCANRLRNIGQAIHAYMTNPVQDAPPDLPTLARDKTVREYLYDGIFWCSGAHFEFPRGEGWQDNMPTQAIYIYVPGLQTNTPDPEHFVVAYEQLSNHQGAGSNILLGDGHVDWWSAEEIERAIPQLKQGKNPPTTQP